MALAASKQIERAIFDAALDLDDPELRIAFLDQACKGDPDLRRRLEELLAVVDRLEGQLTATVHATAAELEASRDLVDALAVKVGRLVFNGFPTGVEVAHAMTHGGPYPATSDGRSTSVGTRAIERFLRPVSLQNCPEEALPPALQEANPLQIRRLVDGT